MGILLEICADSVESAVIAQDAGAGRIELCCNLAEGGTTPSYGTIASARNNLIIKLNVLIRPRSGDFLYSDEEFDIMRRDIEMCGELGVDGIVTGILNPGGTIDIERTARLVEIAYPMTVTFHRAFDMCADPVDGLEDVIATGADRLLTSGLKNKAIDSLEMIRQLIIQAGNRLTIMPGGGIDETNAAKIIETTGAIEIHLTGRKEIDSDMIFRRKDINIGSGSLSSEFSRRIADREKISNIVAILKMF